MAQSMTTTRGLSWMASSTASLPSLASPRTVMRSDTSVRPLRVRQRHAHAHQCPSFAWACEFDRPADERRPLAHCHDAETAMRRRRVGALAVIFDVELEQRTGEAKAHPRLCDAGVPRDIGQRFLKDAIDVNRDRKIDRSGGSDALVRDRNSGLPLDSRNIPVQRPLESDLLEQRGM